ncbi:MAG: AMP-binding protein [Deltaproteobacteria bacterium]|nr:AMP-binding protein [Deltaproteobacteria bacterium]MBW1924009.1 AMP-binding protein [Deltaproteobacteria bacterium]MBW1949435.1 AMP-binding protein [Deltaproteobacteria bacterium]MBW2009792.1 AMP-binding protein [Deltaproteobacteria bacterium]MBW2101236.1 AMP-binding protein [Deltaproteobacteria bacterium]
MNWKPTTLGRMLERVSRDYGDKIAVVTEDQRFTYSQLYRHVDEVARALLAQGIGKGHKVSVWLYNCPEWIFIQLALGRIGAVLVPVNTRFKARELGYTLKQSDSSLLITTDRFLGIDFSELVYETIPELGTAPAGGLVSAEFPELKKVICLGSDPVPSGMLGWEEFLGCGQRVEREVLEAREHDVSPEDVAMFQYTSGTTSFPKGVMLTHDGIIRDSASMGGRMSISHEDRLFCPLPFFHVGGAVISTLIALYYGATLVICRTYDPKTALQIVERERCTAMNGIETHFLMMYEHPDFTAHDVNSLEKGWAIGPPEVIRAVYERMGMKKILNVYGISEASPNVTTTRTDDPLEFRMLWHGKPHPGTEVRIIDFDTKRVLPPGHEGEICVRGWNVMKGYYKKPEETRAALDRDGWLRTGDSGLMDARGNLKFTGRIKDIVRVGGENVSAMEVENFLLTHPKVKNAAVIAVPDPRKTEVCMAVIQLKDGEEATEEEIIGYCKDRIANFKVPRYVRFVDEYPLTGSGKIQKFVLKERFGKL